MKQTASSDLGPVIGQITEPILLGRITNIWTPGVHRSGGTKHATSAPSELGGETHNVSRNRARTKVLLQARKLHVYRSGAFGAFWTGRTVTGKSWSLSGVLVEPGTAHASMTTRETTDSRNNCVNMPCFFV